MRGLVARELSLSLGGRPVLQRVSAAFAPGHITVILGPNGAGKSMLLACLAGLRTPERGEVLLDGRPLALLTPRARGQRIGLLPQKGEVHWDVDVATLVALGRAPHRGRWGDSPADRAAVAAALAATDTAHLADRPVKRLSGGEQARVLLARVLAGQPEWLLADEPLASLDPAHQLDVLALLAAAAHRGAGVVLVLHDLTHAARVAHHAVLLKEGRTLAQGPAADVLAPGPLARAYDVEIARLDDASGKPVLVAAPRSNDAG